MGTTTKRGSRSAPEPAAAGSPGLAPEAEAAHALLEREKSGVLCTAHAARAGWPFGSVVPYAVLPSGDPVVWLSDIAEHTKNLEAEPRASLFVADSEARERPQAGARLSLLVRARRAEGADDASARDAYFARFPDAKSMSSAHGFFLFVLEVVEVRWIAGFGSMGWIARAEWSAPGGDPLAAHRDAICEHMNADHADALLELVAHAGVRATAAKMTSVDRAGLDVEATVRGKRQRVRLPLPAPAATADDVRKSVIAMLGAARRARS